MVSCLNVVLPVGLLQDKGVAAPQEVQTFENGFRSEIVSPLRVDCLTTQ